MASKSVYQDFDTAALTHFGLASASVYGVLTTSGVENVLVTQDQTTYDKIQRLLITPTETDQTFIQKKKAFILPKCEVSQDRLKVSLKEHSITLTNDYELADLVVGHDNISATCEHSAAIPTTLMMLKLHNYEAINSTNGAVPAIDHYANKVILTNAVTDKVRYYSLDIEETLYDEWVITGMALNLAYRIETGLCSVVDSETILHASANKIELDESLLEDLTKMLNSYSNDDISIAGKIIPTIDYTKNYHLLWQLARDCEYKIRNNFNRDKDVQYWISLSSFYTLSNLGAEGMIKWLEKQEKLDKISFKYLEPIVRKEISIRNRELYVFKVSVKPEYLKYLK